MCKPHKANGAKHQVKVKGLKGKVDIRQHIPTLAEKIERDEPSEFELEYFNKF